MTSYEKFLSQSSSALLIIDGENRIVFYNQSAARLLKSLGEAILIEEVIPIENGVLVYLTIDEYRAAQSTIFHQLKAPLSSIKWTTETLLEEKLEEGAKNKLQRIYRSNEYLIRLINDLLSAGRIESGKITAKKKNYDPKNSITKIISILQPLADQKGQKIIFKEHCKLQPIEIDPDLFERAFENLLDNAISYGHADSEINIGVFCMTDNEYAITINNHGPTILPEDQQKIFKKFYRSETAKTTKPAGTGLGLYIAKSSIELNGGRIWFDSRPDTGTTFYFTVPRRGVVKLN